MKDSPSAGGSSNASTPHGIRPPANGLSALDGSPSPNGSPARLRISLKDAVGKVVMQNRVAGAFIEQPEVAKKQAYGYSLGCLSPTNPLRLKVLKLIHHRYFERTVLVAILLNSIAMAAEPADLNEFVHRGDAFKRTRLRCPPWRAACTPRSGRGQPQRTAGWCRRRCGSC